MDLTDATVAELSAELIRKTAGPEALDMFFTLPEWLDNVELRQGYEVIVARMRRECEHVPLNTIQNLLIERIALNYVVLKHKESYRPGEEGGFDHMTVVKDWNTFWLKTTAEFNDLLVKFKPDDRKAVLGEVKSIIISVLNSVEDVTLRSDLIGRLARAFDQMESA